MRRLGQLIVNHSKIVLFGFVGLIALSTIWGFQVFGNLQGGLDVDGQPIAIDQLASQRGGASINRSEMMLSGATADNSATNVVTGSNAIAAGSFANMSGLPLVVQNSGANVLIQNAVIIHVQMQ